MNKLTVIADPYGAEVYTAGTGTLPTLVGRIDRSHHYTLWTAFLKDAHGWKYLGSFRTREDASSEILENLG